MDSKDKASMDNEDFLSTDNEAICLWMMNKVSTDAGIRQHYLQPLTVTYQQLTDHMLADNIRRTWKPKHWITRREETFHFYTNKMKSKTHRFAWNRV